MKTEFQTGDVVRLRSGGPEMVISAISQEDESKSAWITVTWWCALDNKPHSTSMHEYVLKKAGKS